MFVYIIFFFCFVFYEVFVCKGVGGEWGYGGECIIMYGNVVGVLYFFLFLFLLFFFIMWVFGCVNFCDDERIRIVCDFIIFFYFWSVWDVWNCVFVYNWRIEDEEEFVVVLFMIIFIVLGIFLFLYNCWVMLMLSLGV